MSVFRLAAAALALTVLTGGLTGIASAQPRDRHYVRHVRHRPPPRPAWGYDQPSYVAAPPPVVYAPPQAPVMLNFGITLPIR